MLDRVKSTWLNPRNNQSQISLETIEYPVQKYNAKSHALKADLYNSIFTLNKNAFKKFN